VKWICDCFRLRVQRGISNLLWSS